MYVCVCECVCGGVCGVIVIVIENEQGKPISNLRQSCLHFT